MKKERRKDTGSKIKRYRNEYRHAMDGIIYAIEKEWNLLLIMIFILIIFGLCLLFPVTIPELLSIIISAGVLMATEMLNTSIEALTDLVTTQENHLAKIAKDTVSGAVFLFIIMFIFVLGIIFVPKIIELL